MAARSIAPTWWACLPAARSRLPVDCWSAAGVMTDRAEVDALLRGLYAARLRGDLVGVNEYRPLLAVMIKTFKLRDQAILTILIDGTKAAVHWRAGVHSRITGMM